MKIVVKTSNYGTLRTEAIQTKYINVILSVSIIIFIGNMAQGVVLEVIK